MPLNAETVARLGAALENRPGAGNLIAGKFIADPPATVMAPDLRAALTTLAQVALAAKTQKVMNPDQPNPIYDMFDGDMMAGIELP